MIVLRLVHVLLGAASIGALGFMALMAWLGVSVFGPSELRTYSMRFAYLAVFFGAAVLMERAVRTPIVKNRVIYLASVVALGVAELAFMIWLIP